MSIKRALVDLDPDYEDITEQQWKKQKILQDDAKESTIRKIEKIIQKHFSIEIQYKESEVKLIDQRLHEARQVLDRLRACIVANYYSGSGQLTGQMKLNPNQPPVIHPAVKKYLGKTVKNPNTTGDNGITPSSSEAQHVTNGNSESKTVRANQSTTPASLAPESKTSVSSTGDKCHPRFKVKKRIVVGNVSKYIPPDKRDDKDKATHKWMVYVRGPRNEPHIDHFVKKVWFFLHPSYRPNDLVEISQPPFHLTRRGWGEFPVRVQLHFVDSRNKRVDIIHHLKLDKTYTGLQTLGSETHVDIELDRATLPQESIPIMPSHKKNVTEMTNENNTTVHSHSSDKHNRMEQNTSELADNKQENESENSLGVVWSPDSSHDHSKSLDLPADLQLSMLSEDQDVVCDQSILGTDSSVLDSEHSMMDTEKSMLVNKDVLLSSEVCKDLDSVCYTSLSDAKQESPLLNASNQSRSSGRIQISQNVAGKGWTHLQIKQEEGQTESSCLDSSLMVKLSEIKDEPLDDVCPSTTSSSSPPTTTNSTKPSLDQQKNLGFQPIADDVNQPGAGWMHVQIKPEPVSDRPGSASSARTELASVSSTPSPLTQVRLEVGTLGSASLNPAVTDNVQHSVKSPALDKAGDASVWKQTQATSGLKKQTLTLGTGVGQLSSGTQNQVGVLQGQMTAPQTPVTQESDAQLMSHSSQLLVGAGQVSVNSTPLKLSESPPTGSTVSSSKPNPAMDTVYIQCVDSSGKVYLIPQQMLKTTISTEPKASLKPAAPAPTAAAATTVPSAKKDLKTMVVGSGPNKATLTYMLSSQAGQKPAKSVSTQSSKLMAQPASVSVPASVALTQKLLVIPGVGSSPRQLALLQQSSPNDAAVVSPSLQLGSSASQLRPMLIRDQSGYIQIVQMVPPSTHTSSPVSNQRSVTPKSATSKSGICFVAGDKGLLSSPASSKFSPTVVQESNTQGSAQNTSMKSVVFAKDKVSHLHTSQLLQIEVPHGMPSVISSDASVAGVSGTQSTAVKVKQGASVDGSGQVMARSPSGIVQQGPVASKPQGCVSLLRPGLITGKLSSTGLNTAKSVSGSLVAGKLSSPGVLKSSALNVPLLTMPLQAPAAVSGMGGGATSVRSTATKKASLAETPKSSMTGQSLLKSASTGSLMSLPQKQIEVIRNDKGQLEAKNRPLYLSTKIGNQTVLLKIDEFDAKKTMAGDLAFSKDTKTATNLISITASQTATSTETEKAIAGKPSVGAGSGQQMSALAAVTGPIASTIRQGSILGIHKAKEPVKPEHFEINLTKFSDFESLLTFVVSRYPLVEENIDRSVHPYCAQSRDQFLAWNVGKRRAAEWQRACRVRKRILTALNNESSFHGNKVWSTKQILTWCRQHMYTPLDEALTLCYNNKRYKNKQTKSANSHPPGGFSSYTDHKRALAKISELSKSPGGSSEEQEIDIIGIEEPTRNVIKKERADPEIQDFDSTQTQVLPLCGVTQYIHKVAAQIGVNFEPFLLRLDNGSNVLMSLSEEVLLSALRCFLQSLIRKAVALRHHTDRFSEELSARDVYSALEALPRMDFLLNHGLGTHLVDTCCSDDAASDV